MPLLDMSGDAPWTEIGICLLSRPEARVHIRQFLKEMGGNAPSRISVEHRPLVLFS